MDTLFIIGNGFDCYCHGMKTRYKDFRNYIVGKYPNSDKYYGVPGMTLTDDHHDYWYDEEDIVGYIVHILDICQGEDWLNIENALGDDIYSVFEDEFEEIDMDDDDNDIFNNIEQNQVNGNTIGEIFDKIKELFYDWVNEELGDISYEDIECKNNYKSVLRGNRILDKLLSRNKMYINFNYTYTLEEVYKISSEKVWHIHGKVGDSNEQIYFGHGNNNLEFDVEDNWGAGDSFSELGEKLRKDTQKVILNNKGEFRKLKNVRKIYSSGFSFSDVDMIYIEELCKYLKPVNVVWYFNQFDFENNNNYIQKIKELGFEVKEEKRW